MNLSTLFFVFAFLPVSLILYLVCPRVCKNALLVLISFVFYAWGSPVYLLLLLLVTVFNYCVGLDIGNCAELGQRGTKFLLVIGVLFNLLLLGFYKYAAFAIETLNAILPFTLNAPSAALPLGISFFTFQNLSYLSDVYHRRAPAQKNPLDFCLYVSFFPKMISGPIVEYAQFEPQLKSHPVTLYKVSEAVPMLVLGLAKKVLLADNLGAAFQSISALSSGSLSGGSAWLGAICYSLQLYFDFSGYSDMAIGLGRMFNIDIPYNFLSPYKSESFSELWRRWHITLGRALSTYIYIPLGGSRKGRARTFVNTFLTFFVSGLWHGAAWTFVLWGCIHGLFVALEKLFPRLLSAIPRWLRIACTFILVNALWVLFRAESFQQAAMVYSGMLSFTNLDLSQIATLVLDNSFDFPTSVDIAYLFSLLGVLLYVVFCCKNSREKLESFSCTGKSLAFTVFLFCFSVLHLSRESIFIYFNF